MWRRDLSSEKLCAAAETRGSGDNYLCLKTGRARHESGGVRLRYLTPKLRSFSGMQRLQSLRHGGIKGPFGLSLLVLHLQHMKQFQSVHVEMQVCVGVSGRNMPLRHSAPQKRCERISSPWFQAADCRRSERGSSILPPCTLSGDDIT